MNDFFNLLRGMKDACFVFSLLHPVIYLLLKFHAEFLRPNIFIATFCSHRVPGQSLGSFVYPVFSCQVNALAWIEKT